jgi:hypothetical protein
MKIQRAKPFLFLVSFIALVVFIKCSFVLWSYLQSYSLVNNLELIKDPETFTKDFKPAGEHNVKLESYSAQWGFFGGGRLIKSPLPPNRGLETLKIIQGRCSYTYTKDNKFIFSTESRYLHIDQFWKVFWVEIAKCDEGGRFFGPYRFAK